MRPSLKILPAVVVSIALVACGSDSPRPQRGQTDEQLAVRADRLFLTPVLAQSIDRGEIRATVSATGAVVPVVSQAVRVQESGILYFEKPWREGDTVAEGEVIARLVSTAIERELAMNQADVELQQENLDIALRTLRVRESDYVSLQDLYARGIAARRELDSAELERDRSRNAVRQARINLEKSQTNLDDTRRREERLVLRAPFDGIVVSRNTLEGTTGRFAKGFGTESLTGLEGEQLGSGTVICGVAKLEQVIVRCDVTSREVGRIELGQEALAMIYADPEILAEGSVVRVSSAVNPETRAFEVDLLMNNPGGVLRPGMFGRAEVVVDRRFDRLTVPRPAITRRNNVDVVFVVEAAGDAEHQVARMRQVELGLEGRDEIEVVLGLEAGAKVITRGHEVLQDRTPVRVTDLDAPLLMVTDDDEPTTATSNAG